MGLCVWLLAVAAASLSDEAVDVRASSSIAV